MILTPNQKVTVTLNVGATLSLAPSGGVATVERLANPISSADPRDAVQFSDSRSYGPYAIFTVWTVGCVTGTISVTGDFTAAGGGPDATTVTNIQMRLALKEQGKLQDVLDYLSADEDDDATARWRSGAPILFGDALSNWIAARLSYGPTEMSALFNLAATKG